MNNRKTAVVLAAMKVEREYLLSRLSEVKESRVGGFEFYEGVLSGRPTVVARCLIGNVNAALCTYIAIERYSPEFVILQGTAGAHDKTLNKNDIVIADEIVSLMHIKSPRKKAGEGTNPLEWEENGAQGYYKNDGSIRFAQRYSCDERLVDAAKKVEYSAGKVTVGTVGCGDVWNREADLINYYHRTKGTLCEAMEGIGVAQTCAAFGVPMIEIRVISNNELLEGSDFSPETAVNCQQYVSELLKLT